MKRLKTASAFDDIEILAKRYKNHGGKKNRKQQVRKIRRVFAHAKINSGTRSIYELGKKQIIDFYKQNRHLSDPTLYSYWLAVCELYRWLGRPGEPPPPFKNEK